MFKKLKIKTAVLICIVFVIRVLFLNISFFASSNVNISKALKTHYSINKKRRKGSETNVRSLYNENVYQSSPFESIENEDDDSMHVKNAYLLMTAFFINKNFLNPLKSNVLFDLIKCTLFPKKYLALSVIRI